MSFIEVDGEILNVTQIARVVLDYKYRKTKHGAEFCAVYVKMLDGSEHLFNWASKETFRTACEPVRAPSIEEYVNRSSLL